MQERKRLEKNASTNFSLLRHFSKWLVVIFILKTSFPRCCCLEEGAIFFVIYCINSARYGHVFFVPSYISRFI